MPKIVPRHKILAFYGQTDDIVFRRMEKFTVLAKAQGAKEHSTHYVDETSAETGIMGTNPSIRYAFDKFRGLPIQEDIVSITNQNLIGNDAIRSIIIVDTGTNIGFKRDYSVIPNLEGENNSIYTYSGTFHCNGNFVSGPVKTDDDYITISFEDWEPTNENDYIYEVFEDHSETWFYIGSKKRVLMPTTLEDQPITIVHATTFNETAITGLKVPEGIQIIE